MVFSWEHDGEGEDEDEEGDEDEGGEDVDWDAANFRSAVSSWVFVLRVVGCLMVGRGGEGR